MIRPVRTRSYRRDTATDFSSPTRDLTGPGGPLRSGLHVEHKHTVLQSVVFYLFLSLSHMLSVALRALSVTIVTDSTSGHLFKFLRALQKERGRHLVYGRG
jgi:hypothetical protein